MRTQDLDGALGTLPFHTAELAVEPRHDPTYACHGDMNTEQVKRALHSDARCFVGGVW